jgi:serine protease AprX
MNKKIVLISMLFSLAAGLNPVNGQAGKKYFVKFKDKNGTPYITSNASAFLAPKAINRRLTYNTPVDFTDLPCTPSYLIQTDNVPGVKFLYATKWLNGCVVLIYDSVSQSAISGINALPFVNNTSLVNRYKLNLPETPSLEQLSGEKDGLRSAGPDSSKMGGSYWQNKQLNVDCLHEKGYRGQGMTIAVMDVGFYNVNNNPMFDSLRNRGGILGTRDFVSGGNSVYEDPDHGTYVLSCMAAIKHGVIMGSAPMADYWLLRTEETSKETLSEEYNWIRAAEFADSLGADILTTSLGYTWFDNSSQSHTLQQLDGKTAPMSIAATMAARKGLFVLNAAGNEGGGAWQKIAVPADADSICTVGAIDSLGLVASFSSTGPTADGRIKPDLVARGVGSWVSNTAGTGAFPGNGTSFATPILAGAVACFWQAHPERNNIEVLQLLKASANNALSPNNSKGWGVPDVCNAAPLSINDHQSEWQKALSVFPNPFHASLTVRMSATDTKIVVAELTDVLGRVVQTVKPADLGSNSLTIPTSQIPEGVYFVRLTTSSGIVSKKIVKQ